MLMLKQRTRGTAAAALHPDGVAFVALDSVQSPAVELAATWRADADNPALARAVSLLQARVRDQAN
jgi:hypothetical protein